MFKNIPGNSEFQIALNGEIVNKDNTGRNPVIIGSNVFIDIFGNNRCVDISWLTLIAHFEVNLPNDFKNKIWNIIFTEINFKPTKPICNQVMIFKKPLVILNKYRIIPNFTNYAISKEGEVYDIIKNCTISIKLFTHDDYPQVYIFNPDRNAFRYIRVHRLVALAWVKNNDYIGKSVVNHKDGNKKNFHYSNLEWCSYYENSIHATNTGLRPDNFLCKIRDVTTKEIHLFHSVKQACNFMGISDDTPISRLVYKTKHRLVNDRYEVKLQSDTSSWFYEKHEIGKVAGRYILNVTMPDGSIQEHPDVRTFKQVFKVWNTSNINELVSKAETMYPGMKIEVIDNYNVTPIQAYNLNTKEIIEATGIRQMCRIVGEDYARIRGVLMIGETRIVNSFAYRYKTDKSWDMNFAEYKCSSKCVLATHKETDEKMKFSSQREAAKHFNIDRSVIRRFLKSGRYFRLWKLSETES